MFIGNAPSKAAARRLFSFSPDDNPRSIRAQSASPSYQIISDNAFKFMRKALKKEVNKTAVRLSAWSEGGMKS
jgi:hypothetical protein